MAQRMKMSESPGLESDDENIYNATPEPLGRQPRHTATSNASSVSPSPTASTLSDKENLVQTVKTRGKSRGIMPPPQPPTPSSSARVGKRKRANIGDTLGKAYHQRRRTEGSQGNDSDDSSDAYDPDQSLEERRKIRGQLREIEKDLTENRAEYTQPDSTGLLDSIYKANEVASSVKQPTDATIDARILLTTADYAYKKTVQAISGESVQGVDADQFIAKCIGFMRRADGSDIESRLAALSATQRRRKRQTGAGDSDDAVGDEGDMLNWTHLGRFACLQHNTRPSVPGFLLGPLSVEKRARRLVQRSQALKHSSLKLTQAEVVSPEEVEKSENANLTVLCSRILGRLKKVQRDGQAAVEKEYKDEMSQADIDKLMDKYGVDGGGGVDYFKFVVNPLSFGQTVENMFYVSFLIRDGKAGITIVESGLPMLEATEPRGRNGKTQDGVSKHQAVLALDFSTWKELVDVFNITEPMIPHRENSESQPGAQGWYT